jgi:hypothetical protein
MPVAAGAENLGVVAPRSSYSTDRPEPFSQVHYLSRG